MAVLDLAIDLERVSEKRYIALAGQTAYPGGRTMFEQLAKEERTHRRILDNAYSNLNDRGEWNWWKEPPPDRPSR
jgi:rubrerythrin